jgi:exonuclease SbcC
MLKKLTIRNFGTHAKLDIDLERITCFVGESYSGKSTIIRALRWVILNKPTSTRVIKWGCKQATVTLYTDRGAIRRIRSASKNLYMLKRGKKVEKFVAFGNDVPGPIKSLLNISEDQFQFQHSQPFWFCETAGQVSKQLNQIISLDLIDRFFKHLSQQKSETAGTISMSEYRLDRFRKEDIELSYVPEIEREYKKLVQLEKKAEALLQDVQDIQTTITKLNALKLRTRRPPSFDHLQKCYFQAEADETDTDNLRADTNRISELEEEVSSARIPLADYGAALQRKEGEQCPLCGNPRPKKAKAKAKAKRKP